MYTKFNTPIIDTKCPDDMKISTCPLRKFIESKDSPFHVSANETLLMQNADCTSDKFIKAVLQMHAICNACKAVKLK